MDPSRNAALYNAKIKLLNSDRQTSSPGTNSTQDMPAPPAYHTVVNPNTPIPQMRSSYESDEGVEKDEDDEASHVSVNAATQIRGNGNIISVQQYDTMRLATLIAQMIHSLKTPEPASPTHAQFPGHTLPSLSALSDNAKKSGPKINVTVSCGATVIGDRNIVGPGLGEIARQMQLSQRAQAVHAHQAQCQAQAQAQTRAQAQAQSLRADPGFTLDHRENLYQAQASIAQNHGLGTGHAPTPPMSRSPSVGSGSPGGGKRKAEEGVKDEPVKRRC